MLRVAEHVERTDTGRAAARQRGLLLRPLAAVRVADGMGGAQAGEVASTIAVEVSSRGCPTAGGTVEQRLRRRVRRGQRAHPRRSPADDQDLAGMGTTLTAAYVGEDELTIAHVGDSRLYRCATGALERLTDDHSLVEELVRQGKLTPEEAERAPAALDHHPRAGARAGVAARHAHVARPAPATCTCSAPTA